MKELSIFEKLKVLVDVSSSSGLCIASLFIIIFLAVVMLTTNKKNKKSTKIFFGIVYLALLVVMLIQYWESLSSMFDYMMNNFFIVVYFPNLAIYLAAIIATNIILWKTIFSKKQDKVLKIINVSVYSLIHYLLVLILNVVSSNKLNVFDKSSVYGDNNALALIGLSSSIFMIWIAFMIIYNIIRSRQLSKMPIEETVKYKLPSNILEIAVPKKVKEVVKYKYKLPSNIIDIAVPQEVVRVNQISAPKLVKDIAIKKALPKEDMSLVDFYNTTKLMKEYDNVLTLDDYKTVLNILKNNKNKQLSKEEQPVCNINYNYNTNTNIVEEYKENVVQPKLDELLNLSKSV